MTRKLYLGLALALVPVVPLGCARSPDEPGLESRPEQFAPPPTDAELAEAPAEESQPRDLAELQRELQNKEADLRRLGVEIPGAAEAATEAKANADPTDATTKQESAGGRDSTPRKSKKGKTASKPKADMSTGSQSVPGGAGGGLAPSKPSAGDGLVDDSQRSSEKSKDEDSDMAGEPRPDEAKATHAPPDSKPRAQAEEHCPLICSLSDGTCELAQEICSLAERHPGDDDYANACERATDDCELAKDACLECLG